MIAHRMNAWATELGMDQQTLERRLIKAGLDKPKKGWGEVPFKSIRIAIMGDEQSERIRNLKLDADEKEMELKLAQGAIHTRDGVEEIVWNRGLAQIRSALLGYESLAGQKLKTFLASSGVSEEIANEAVRIAVAGVIDPLEKIRATFPGK